VRTCTLDEASARKVAIGMSARARHLEDEAFSRIAFPSCDLSRNKFLRAASAATRNALGERLLMDVTEKRRHTSVFMSFEDGEIGIVIGDIRYAERERAVVNSALAMVITQHATARILQRLGTNELSVVCAELRPAGHAILSVVQNGVSEGRVARIPTLSGHLVIPHVPDGEMLCAVTFCTDTGSGDEKLQAIQNARRIGGYITSADRALQPNTATA